MKRDLIKILVDEIYSKHPTKNYPSNKLVNNCIDEIWSVDLVDLIDYKIVNNKEYKYIFIIIDIFSKFVGAIFLKNKNTQSITQNFSNILTKSER